MVLSPLILLYNHSVLFSSVQSLSHVRLFAAPWTAAPQASLSITNSQSLPKLMSIESVMPSNHLILCHLLLLLPSVFPSISSVQFSSVAQSCPTVCDPMNSSMPGLPESAVCIRWPSHKTYTFLEGTNRTLCAPGPRRKEQRHHETDPDLPVSVQEPPAEAWVSSGLPQGWGH